MEMMPKTFDRHTYTRARTRAQLWIYAHITHAHMPSTNHRLRGPGAFCLPLRPRLPFSLRGGPEASGGRGVQRCVRGWVYHTHTKSIYTHEAKHQFTHTHITHTHNHRLRGPGAFCLPLRPRLPFPLRGGPEASGGRGVQRCMRGWVHRRGP